MHGLNLRRLLAVCAGLFMVSLAGTLLWSRVIAPLSDNDPSVSFDLSPCGSRIVFNSAADRRWGLYLLRLRDRQLTHLLATEDIEERPCFSPDGESVVYSRRRAGHPAAHLCMLSLRSRQVVRLTEPGPWADTFRILRRTGPGQWSERG
jgi:Tol biopolymer transport system component